MICVSIAEKTSEACLTALAGIDFAEIRIDEMETDKTDIKKIFSSHPRLIATCRPGKRSSQERLDLLHSAIEAGAAYVDIEVEAEGKYKDYLISRARSSGCQVIISYHNFQKTPQKSELEHIIEWCFTAGADIAKIACMVQHKNETARLLGLLNDERPLIVLGMGKLGRITRIAAPLLGSPFTYASPGKGRETAAGQLDRKTLEKMIRIINDA